MKRIASIILLSTGLLLVFLGLGSALGFTRTGIVASAAAMAGLLYAGAVWFGGAAARRVTPAEEREVTAVGSLDPRR